MSEFADRLTHYETKCRQHLSRVRLSHVLALGTLSGGQVQSEEIAGLIRASFDDEILDRYETKVRTVLHHLHLLSLKTNFELFLNRLLTTVWTFQFPVLSLTIPRDMSLLVRDLATEFGHTIESTVDVRNFIIDKIVAVHGLQQLKTALQKTIRIALPHVLNHKNIHYWPQIYTAFEVRHLVEHRDGRVDREFVRKMALTWVQSSWGKHGIIPEPLEKVPVEEEDVIKTYEAMSEATSLLTTEVLRWSGQTNGPPQVENTAP